ncbi:IS3 family transposase [Oryzomonas japonica]|uniref:IS3 family transposase n=1 Tax=Oryzomonas japonica TaxID=2603858 RepID=A0A7J4ZMM6_9BACT|nr:IS3 family transposase [Oryzomonas japonica]KAB0663828.1 IS3 family transposase [Oryzomonas japonica]
MKGSRFTGTQIISILRETEAGMLVKDVCRKHGIGDATYYNWKSKYGGMSASDLKRMKEMEAELSRLKRMHADMALENHASEDLIEKKPLRPPEKRDAAIYLVAEHRLSVQRSCRCIGLSRAAYYRVPVYASETDHDVIKALNALVERHPRWGFWKCFKALRRLGQLWNHKRVYRVYCTLQLNQKRRTKKRLPQRIKQPLLVPQQPNQTWSADFVSDALYAGRRFRTFNVSDDFNRECLAVEIDTSLTGTRLVRVFGRLRPERGLPNVLRADNGPEFLSGDFVAWAETNGMAIQYIQPGEPNQNAYIERFNRTYREELLSMYLFNNLSEVREETYWWRNDYNELRPHDSLGDMTPAEYMGNGTRNSALNLST